MYLELMMCGKVCINKNYIVCVDTFVLSLSWEIHRTVTGTNGEKDYLSSDTLTCRRRPLCSEGGGAGLRVSLASPRSNRG